VFPVSSAIRRNQSRVPLRWRSESPGPERMDSSQAAIEPRSCGLPGVCGVALAPQDAGVEVEHERASDDEDVLLEARDAFPRHREFQLGHGNLRVEE
jgi:hypothetical protein